MLVKVSITEEGKGVVEGPYIVPDGSWVQTKTCGAQYAEPALAPIVYGHQRGGLNPRTLYIIIEPGEAPPLIGASLLKLVNGHDKKWGRNGHEWMGCHREQQGGSALDRCREYVIGLQWRSDPPVILSPQEIQAIREA